MPLSELSALKPSTLVVAALALILAASMTYAFLQPGQHPPQPSQLQQPPSPRQPATPTGRSLDFELVDVYGQTFKLSDHRGKVVILDLMATWCAPCEGMVKELRQVKEELGDSVVIVSVSVDIVHDTDDVLRSYAKSKGITWTVARDTVGLADMFEVAFIPTLVVIDPEGEVYLTHVGYAPASEVLQWVQEAAG